MKLRKKGDNPPVRKYSGPLNKDEMAAMDAIYPSTAPVQPPMMNEPLFKNSGTPNPEKEARNRALYEDEIISGKLEKDYKRKGGSVINGKQLRRQAFSKGLRTSRKHK